MTHIEKIEMLKETIIKLYEKEGRSKSYISDLLNVDRKILVQKINEWELIKADKRHLTPSNEKFLNKNRQVIIDMLDSDFDIIEIAKKIEKSRSSLLKTFIYNDKELLHHYNMYNKRKEIKTQEKIKIKKEKSSRNYKIEEIDGEIWKEILGFDNYFISNMGRVKKLAKRYNDYYLLTITYNQVNGYGYVSLVNNEGKRKNINIARLVAHNFVSGYSDTNNTVDHKDGNKSNNISSNLEWVSQSCNNQRAYDNGKPTHKGYYKRGKFQKIIMDKKYEFKTIRALAKFLQVSETQVNRYLDGTSKTEHTFQIIY
jgi:hypothetical protein